MNNYYIYMYGEVVSIILETALSTLYTTGVLAESIESLGESCVKVKHIEETIELASKHQRYPAWV